MLEEKLKQCCFCKCSKSLDLFFNDASRKDRKSPRCKECHIDVIRRWEKENPEAHLRIKRNKHLKKTYNITLKDYEMLLEQQNYRCKICNSDEAGSYESFAVDHNHDTGKVRGLLCFPCNFLLGNCREDVNVLHSAVLYLQENNDDTIA